MRTEEYSRKRASRGIFLFHRNTVSYETKTPDTKTHPGQDNHAKKAYLLSSRLYCRYRSHTGSTIYEALKNVPAFTSLLGRDKDSFVPIERSKEELFREMVNDNYEIAMSCGLIEGDKVTITDGPLAGKEAMICKINRHKRTATLNVEMFGDKAGVTVGLEVVENWTITIIENFQKKIRYNIIFNRNLL